MSTRTHSTLQSRSQYGQYGKNPTMAALHKEFKNLSNGYSSAKAVRKLAEDLGYKPTHKLDMALREPQCSFNQVVRHLGKFQKPTTQERLSSNHIDNFNKYKRLKPSGASESKNAEVKALQQFARGQISKGALKEKVGVSKTRKLDKALGRMIDGGFSKVAIKVFGNDERRSDLLEGPQNVPLKTTLTKMTKNFQGAERITTKRLHDLALRECDRKTHWLEYPEKRGEGLKDAIPKLDNGDFVTWNRDGALYNQSYVTKPKIGREKRTQDMKGTIAYVAPVRTMNRRDFNGTGNIISWC